MNRGLNFCAGLCLTFLLGFLTIVLISLSHPKGPLGSLLGNRQQNLTIGIFFEARASENKQYNIESIPTFHERMLNMTLQAVQDINLQVIQEQSRASFGARKLAYVHGIPFEWKNGERDEVIVAQLNVQIDKGIRIFFGCFKNSNKIGLLTKIFKNKQCNDCIVASPCSTPLYQDPIEVTSNTRTIQTGLSEEEKASAFLQLFTEFNSLPNKSLEVVPVLRADNESLSFLEMIKNLSEEKKNHSNDVHIRWANPVKYIPSSYPKSDAFQIVSDVGARLAMSEENTVVFLISSETLPQIIDMSRVNRELRRRKWFVKDIWSVEHHLLSRLNSSLKPGVEKFCTTVSLTTLSFLDRVNNYPQCNNIHNTKGDNNIKSNLPINSYRDMAFKHMDSSNRRGSMYLELLAYESIYKIYQAFHSSSFSYGFAFAALKDIFMINEKSKCSRSIAASIIYKPINEAVRTIPDLGSWMVQGFITINSQLRTDYEPLYTHPMVKSEITKILTTLNKGGYEKRQCIHPNITIWLHPTILTPETTLNFKRIEEFPETALILPAKGGVSLSLDCKNSEHSARTAHHFYACVPRQYDVGNLTCMTFVDRSREDLVNHERMTRSSHSIPEEISKLDSRTRLQHFNNLLKEYSSKYKWNTVWKKTRDLLPSVMGCGASVAGCDYCMYFLTTYNLTASPAACVGGCSLGTFASCSALVGSSFVSTFLKN